MSEQFRLGLNETVVVSILKQVSNRFTSYNGVKVVADFNDRVLLGKGKTGFISSKGVCLTVGIAGLSKVSEPRCRFSVFKFGESGEPRVVDDLSFVACLVTLGHEYGHYLQDYGPDYDAYDIISEISAVGNRGYYNKMSKFLPYEIDAEEVGVTMAWDVMTSIFPNYADSCMLEYMNHMARQSEYFISNNGSDFKSKTDVLSAFAKAKHDSIYESRELVSFHQFRSDVVYRLLVPDVNNLVRSPYLKFFDKITDHMTGEKKDRMMAALMIHVRPGLLSIREELQHEDLSVEHEFGLPFPETSEESCRRLSIPYLPDLSGPLDSKSELSDTKVVSRRSTCELDRAYHDIIASDMEAGRDDYSL